MNHYRVWGEETVEPRLTVRTFGRLNVLLHGTDVSDKMPLKVGALVAYLACEPAFHARRDLCTLLWGSERLTSGSTNLRVALMAARAALGPLVTISRYGVGMAADAPCWVDAHQLQTAVDLLPPDAGRGHLLDGATIAQLERAVALYDGEFLQELTPPDAPAFSAWRKYRQAQYRALIHRAFAVLTHAYLDAGEHRRGIEVARRWTALDPLEESSQRMLLQLHAEAGHTQDALHIYAAYQELLQRTLQVAPGPELQALHRSLRRLSSCVLAPVNDLAPAHDPATVAAHVGGAPQRGAQAAAWRGVGRGAPFVGRARELLALERLVCAPAPRLITIAGSDGSGKTRLVRQFLEWRQDDAAQCDEFADGLLLLPANLAHSPDELVTLISSALKLDTPDIGQSSAQHLAEALATRRVLLILDDLDPGLARTLLAQWLSTTDAVKFLVTARAPLAIAQEYVITLAGLPLPPAAASSAAIDEAAASRCFLDAAAMRLTAPYSAATRRAIAEVCRLLGGLPLALQLAGALTTVYTYDEMARLLHERLARAHFGASAPEAALRAMFELVWEQLDAWLQRAYLRLASFACSFSAETASAAAFVTPSHLATLQRVGLVEPCDEGARFQLHPMLRRLAHERLDASTARTTAYRWHGDYFARFVREHSTLGCDHSMPARLARLATEIVEIRTAFERAVRQQRWEVVTAMALPMAHFYALRGPREEGHRLLSRALAQAAGLAGAVGAALHTARAMVNNRNAAYRDALADARLALRLDPADREVGAFAEAEWGRAAFHLAAYGEARLHLERALHLAQSAGLAEVEARALTVLGLTLLYSGEYERGVQLTYAALHFSRKHHLPLDEARLLNQLGMVFYYQGRYTTAQQHYLHAQQTAEAIGDAATTVAALISIGAVAQQLGDYQEAAQQYNAALRLMQTSGERTQEAVVLADLGLVAHQCGEHQRALHHLASAEQLAFKRGQRDVEAFALTSKGHALATAGAWDDAEDCFGRALQLRQLLGQTQQTMEPLAGLVQVAVARGDTTAALALTERMLPVVRSPQFVAVIDIFGVYWRCYQALIAAGDPRADELLASGYQALMARAAQIDDAPMRAAYLEKVAVHRTLVETYQRQTCA